MLTNTTAHKKKYKEKKAEFLKKKQLLLEGQKLIYSGFVDGIFYHDKYIELVGKRHFLINMMIKQWTHLIMI